jgi:hypothetical protein
MSEILCLQNLVGKMLKAQSQEMLPLDKPQFTLQQCNHNERQAR